MHVKQKQHWSVMTGSSNLVLLKINGNDGRTAAVTGTLLYTSYSKPKRTGNGTRCNSSCLLQWHIRRPKSPSRRDRHNESVFLEGVSQGTMVMPLASWPICASRSGSGNAPTLTQRLPLKYLICSVLGRRTGHRSRPLIDFVIANQSLSPT